MPDLGPAVSTVVRRCRDVVVLEASLEVDGRPVLDAGRFVLD